MPKMKTKSSAFKSHILPKKATDRKRRLTHATLVHPSDVKSVKEQLVL